MVIKQDKKTILGLTEGIIFLLIFCAVALLWRYNQDVLILLLSIIGDAVFLNISWGSAFIASSISRQKPKENRLEERKLLKWILFYNISSSVIVILLMTLIAKYPFDWTVWTFIVSLIIWIFSLYPLGLIKYKKVFVPVADKLKHQIINWTIICFFVFLLGAYSGSLVIHK